ncbi:FecR family protein [Prevotella sp. KH2C16]|uniref:FecR family protein n=1 Tax=Prevotella sp. KH2C16 TaxID=1855325 RepID=UPI0008F1D85A|nr:FecR domain-containing protein [Prevotella sp. KH2C16]SFG03150.1 ferric-dicitrate binding protein FerR, regulates iron transport through sigma-19 [Prevotella sp. KH2C16]
MLKNAKQLATRYFEGKITRDEENALFEFIEQGDDQRALFHRWETEWKEQQTAHAETERAWLHFASNTIEAKAKSVVVLTLRHRIAIAAAVVALVMITAFSTWQLIDNLPGHEFALTTPMGSKSELTLPDGSKVWLNAGSTLKYTSQFDNNNREVKLEGEGYFEVAKKESGSRFVVKTRGYDVVVKGTHFDVSAYKDDPFIRTSLLEGSVLIDAGNDRLMMQPGEMVTLNTSTGALIKTNFSNDSHAWIRNMTDFDEITLEEFTKILSRQYAVRIHILSNDLKTTKLSISLRNKETIDEVLVALQRITDMKVTRNGKDIYMAE